MIGQTFEDLVVVGFDHGISGELFRGIAEELGHELRICCVFVFTILCQDIFEDDGA
jgi:hypothetical protein